MVTARINGNTNIKDMIINIISVKITSVFFLVDIFITLLLIDNAHAVHQI
jgi:hypothetical protein